MKKCFLSTYHPSILILCWWLVVLSGPFFSGNCVLESLVLSTRGSMCNHTLAFLFQCWWQIDSFSGSLCEVFPFGVRPYDLSYDKSYRFLNTFLLWCAPSRSHVVSVFSLNYLLLFGWYYFMTNISKMKRMFWLVFFSTQWNVVSSSVGCGIWFC
jgi:hypothetical protein